MRICKICEIEKNINSFHANRNVCSACYKERALKSYLNDISKPIERCKFCGAEIKDGVGARNKLLGYCSNWCREEAKPIEIKHTCKTCGTATDPVLVKIKNSNKEKSKIFYHEESNTFVKKSGMYYELCFKCFIKKYGKIYKTFNMLDNDKITLEEIEEKWKQKNAKSVVKNV